MKVSEWVKDAPANLCSVPWGQLGDFINLILESNQDGVERALSFCLQDPCDVNTPQSKGEEYGVYPPECPGKIGDFHTHPLSAAHPSVGDWNWHVRNRSRAFCVGWPTRSRSLEKGKDVEYRRAAVECFTFDVDHPEYEPWRQRFEPIGEEAHKYNADLVKSLSVEKRASTSAESAKYNDYRDKIDVLVKEAKGKGLIKECVARDWFGTLEVPDWKLHRKPDCSVGQDVGAVKECNTISELMRKEYEFLVDQMVLAENDPKELENLCEGWVKSSLPYIEGRENKARKLKDKADETKNTAAASACYDAIQNASLAKGKAKHLIRKYCEPKEST